MKYYTKEIHELKELDYYPDELMLWSAPFGLKLLDLVSYKAGISVLDIGFGNGFPLLELAMRLGESSNLTGIDSSENANTVTKKK